MAAGGIHDQLGGGFHRYATDARWRVPHFERRLHDNARLVLAYVEAWQVTGRADFARTARAVLEALERDFGLPGGGFASASGADSAGPDGTRTAGRYFTWTPAEVDAALGVADGALARAWFGVRDDGPVEGRSVLHVGRTPEAVAQALGRTPEAVAARLAPIRTGLLAARSRRPPPLRDDKVVAAWNGLATSAFARAGFAFDEPRFVERARRAARFVLDQRREDGRLRRVTLGTRAEGPAFLDDHALMVAGLLDLAEASSEAEWLREALALQAVQDRDYGDAEGGGYWRTPHDVASPLVREKPGRDGAVPAGNAVAASNLLRLTALSGDGAWRERALRLFAAFHDALVSEPTAHAEMLLALDFELDRSREVIVVRPPPGGDDALLAVLRRAHLPNAVVAVVTEGEALDAHAPLVPLVRSKKARGGAATAYVCVDRVCRFPTSDPSRLAEQLADVHRFAAAAGDQAAESDASR